MWFWNNAICGFCTRVPNVFIGVSENYIDLIKILSKNELLYDNF